MNEQRTHHQNDPETIAALEFLTVRELKKAGWNADEILGFLVCAHTQGGLREGAPKWLRRQQAFLLTHGKGIEKEIVEPIRQRLQDKYRF
jgi:hypothetical protein